MAIRKRIPRYSSVNMKGVQYYRTFVEGNDGKRIALILSILGVSQSLCKPSN